ncbi:class I SAM-dependent methyltransferase [Salinimicrobium sp. CAU 1759]
MAPVNKTDLNRRQQEFYDNKKKNLPTRVWSYFRNGLLNRTKKGVGIESDIYELHRSWFGDLSNKKVLDLGCYAGNSLSIYLAQNSSEYLGIDLSPKGIKNLSGRLSGLSGARAEVMDFLSDDFTEKDFDLIYAYGVLHHFKDVDELILKLKEKLKPNGSIVSHDPLETSLPIKTIRTIYRPFQSDKDWEWPFSKKTFYKFDEAFEITERRAVLGKTKWLPFLNLLPGSSDKKLEKAQGWHREDWEKSAINDEYMFGCMHLSMLMKKRT